MDFQIAVDLRSGSGMLIVLVDSDSSDRSFAETPEMLTRF